MRVIVRETSLPKLRVGNLFIVTKDGGTIGREGEQHTILLRDNNVSRVSFVFIYIRKLAMTYGVCRVNLRKKLGKIIFH